jgi:hypothetical protein
MRIRNAGSGTLKGELITWRETLGDQTRWRLGLGRSCASLEERAMRVACKVCACGPISEGMREDGGSGQNASKEAGSQAGARRLGSVAARRFLVAHSAGWRSNVLGFECCGSLGGKLRKDRAIWGSLRIVAADQGTTVGCRSGNLDDDMKIDKTRRALVVVKSASRSES